MDTGAAQYARRNQYAIAVTLAMLWIGLLVVVDAGVLGTIKTWIDGKIQ